MRVIVGECYGKIHPRLQLPKLLENFQLQIYFFLDCACLVICFGQRHCQQQLPQLAPSSKAVAASASSIQYTQINGITREVMSLTISLDMLKCIYDNIVSSELL